MHETKDRQPKLRRLLRRSHRPGGLIEPWISARGSRRLQALNFTGYFVDYSLLAGDMVIPGGESVFIA